MPIEPNYRYPDDLDPTLPLDNDPVGEGDDHIRGTKASYKAVFTGDDTEARLLVGGAVKARANSTGLQVLNQGGYAVRNNADDGNIYQQFYIATSAMYLDHQVNGEGIILRSRKATGENARLIEGFPSRVSLFTDDTERVRAGSTVPFAVLGNLSDVVGVGETRHQVRSELAGIATRVDASGNVHLERRDAAGANPETIIKRTISTGATEVYHGDQVVLESIGAGRARLVNQGSAGNGGRVEFEGEGAHPDGAIDNRQGRIRILVNDALTEAVAWDNTGKLSQKQASEFLGFLEIVGADMTHRRTNNTEISRKVYGSNGGYETLVQSGLGVRYSIDGSGVNQIEVERFDRTGRFKWRDPGTNADALATRVTGANTRAEVYDDAGNAQPVGFNGVPRTDMGTGTTYNLPTDGSANGRRFRRSSSANTSCVIGVASLGADHCCKIYNQVNSGYTITIPSGLTARWYSGAGVVERVGPSSFTLASGGAMWATGFSNSIVELDGPLS